MFKFLKHIFQRHTIGMVIIIIISIFLASIPQDIIMSKIKKIKTYLGGNKERLNDLSKKINKVEEIDKIYDKY